MEEYEVVPQQIRLSDVLDQIERVNAMIDLHVDNPFMRDQYERRRAKFIDELREILLEYRITPGDLAA